VEPKDDAVRAFTITIADADMYVETKGMTFGTDSKTKGASR
jgi:hypothetical protein